MQEPRFMQLLGTSRGNYNSGPDQQQAWGCQVANCISLTLHKSRLPDARASVFLARGAHPRSPQWEVKLQRIKRGLGGPSYTSLCSQKHPEKHVALHCHCAPDNWRADARLEMPCHFSIGYTSKLETPPTEKPTEQDLAEQQDFGEAARRPVHLPR